MSAPYLRSLYRSFLRELPSRHAILARPAPPLHQALRERLCRAAHKSELALSEQYLAYLQAQRTYVELLERYNPGVGMDGDERVRLTARRVGLALPVEHGKGK